MAKQLTLEEIAEKKAKALKDLEELNTLETETIKASQAQAFTDLQAVLNKYKLPVSAVITTLLESGTATLKDLDIDEKHYVLCKCPVNKKNRAGEMESSYLLHYKGKVYISDQELAKQACAMTWDKFQESITELGKQEQFKQEVKDFFNKYTQAQFKVN